jgi:hypothetical protein
LTAPALAPNHLIVDLHGVPLGVALTGGNRNDVTQQLLPLVDGIGARANAAGLARAPTR